MSAPIDISSKFPKTTQTSMFLDQFQFNNVHFYTQRSIFFYSQHFLHFYSLLHLHLWVDCQNILLQIFSNNRCAIIQINFVLCFKLSQRSLCVSSTNSNTSGSITIISTFSKLMSSWLSFQFFLTCQEFYSITAF